jgi:hypothetical protein
MRLVHVGWFMSLILGSGVVVAADKAEDDPQTKKDIAVFRAYLQKSHAGKKWQTGPARIDSAEIRAAYGDRRFYFVFTPPPQPPGAFSPLLQKQFQERVEDYRKNHISLTVGVDKQGTLTPLLKPEDCNVGLMKVQTDADAKTAAAAILLLNTSNGVGPMPVGASDVTVTRTAKGWTCQVTKRNAFAGTVTFDPAGKCTAVTKQSLLPLPP